MPGIGSNRLFSLAMGGLLGVAAASSADAATKYVNVALASGANDGSSWANAYQGPTGLVTAIAAAGSGDQVWVAAGVYKPTATATRSIFFTLKNGVAIYGGFAGNEVNLADRNIAANLTTLSADLSGNDGPPGTFTNNADNSYHVVNAASTNSTAVLDGFTITGGNANGADASNFNKGGGILLVASSNSTIRNCSFIYNKCTFGGGAGYINASSPVFTDCLFQGNQGGSFGGAFDQSTNCATQFTRCRFISNSAARAGGVECFGGTTTAFTNCVFRGNTATGSGGGGAIWIGSASNPTIRLCTITGNNATVNFAGIHNTGTSANISNCIIYGNTGPGGSQAVTQQVNAAGGTNTVTYSDVQGGIAGAGNINIAPQFIDSANGDLHLAAGSPGIDAGNNAAVPGTVTTDLDSQPRFVNDPDVTDTGAGAAPIVDMGAYERQIPIAPPCPADVTDNGVVDIDDLLAVINNWGATGANPADVTGNGIVDIDDLLLVINGWGDCP